MQGEDSQQCVGQKERIPSADDNVGLPVSVEVAQHDVSAPVGNLVFAGWKAAISIAE
jgi:hypothetical protein